MSGWGSLKARAEGVLEGAAGVRGESWLASPAPLLRALGPGKTTETAALRRGPALCQDDAKDLLSVSLKEPQDKPVWQV